jgi:beta-glucosidase
MPEPKYLNKDLTPDERVNDLLERMTLREKIGQMCQYMDPERYEIEHPQSVATENDPAEDEHFLKPIKVSDIENLVEQGLIGSLLYLPGIAQINHYQSLARKSRLKIPLFICTDAIHGHGFYKPAATIFPSPLGLSSTWEPGLLEEAARITAKEMRATGFHNTFSPNIEVTRDPRWGRTGETFGEDPFLVSEMGSAMIRGYQGRDCSSPESVLACGKHFIGGSEPANGLNFSPMDMSERKLREIFLPPFVAAVRAGVASVMAAHNEINGTPCHANKRLLGDILRQELGFKGFVISDWLDVERIFSLHRIADSRKKACLFAVRAGVDIHMHGPGFLESVEHWIKQRDLSEKKVHEAAKAARKSIVLLKNKDTLLPLSGNIKKILVTGPNADNQTILGDWVWRQPEENVTTILQGIRGLVSDKTEVDYFDCGSVRNITDDAVKQAAIRAKKAEVAVIVAGENAFREDGSERTGGENVGRSHIELFGKQLELIRVVHATRTPVVLVLVNCRPLAIEWCARNLQAIIEAWEPGMAGGRAVAEVLFGIINPGGRLTMTIPRSTGHLRDAYNLRPSHNFREYADAEMGPLYEFGYGLSYTAFKYSALKIPKKIKANEDLEIKVRVENTGKRAGDEVVQVYINDLVSSVTTPVRELKAFKRISIDPGKNKEVEFVIRPDRLALYDENLRRVVEPGKFELITGDLRAEFEVVQQYR